MVRRNRTVGTRLRVVLASLVAIIVCVPAAAMNASEDGGLNVPALLGALSVVLVLGLHVQSTRRRTI